MDDAVAEQPEWIVYARSNEDVARQVASMEHTRLQAWCAEAGRTGSDVAIRVVDTREPAGETADVLCDEIWAAQEPVVARGASTEEAVGEAHQGLTPFGLGCAAAGLTLVWASFKFCQQHPHVKNCGEKFGFGGGGLAVMCAIFF
jgi:hypothetical protein